MLRYGKISVLTILTAIILFLPLTAEAQPKAAGLGLSYYSITAEYQQWSKKGSTFHNLGLTLDLNKIDSREVILPGYLTSYSYQFTGSRMLPRGNEIVFYAGPGAVLGWVKDYETRMGVALGLKANAGIELKSAILPLSVGIDINPVLGMHIHYEEGQILMGTYINGLISSIIPEISVKYNFDSTHRNFAYDASDRQRYGENKLFTLGVEHSYTIMFLRHRHYNYWEEDNTRHFINKTEPCIHTHASISLNAGINFAKNFNFSAAFGYSTLGSRATPSIPLTGRFACNINLPSENQYLIANIKAGSAVCFRKDYASLPVIIGAGAIYRLGVGNWMNFDMMCNILCTHLNPLIPDAARISISTENSLGLELGIGVSF